MKKALLYALSIGFLVSGQAAYSKPPFLKKAKELALPGIENCMACHISTEKGAVKWNERGLWLRAKKQELSAGDIDVTWLKDFKPAS